MKNTEFEFRGSFHQQAANRLYDKIDQWWTASHNAESFIGGTFAITPSMLLNAAGENNLRSNIWKSTCDTGLFIAALQIFLKGPAPEKILLTLDVAIHRVWINEPFTVVDIPLLIAGTATSSQQKLFDIQCSLRPVGEPTKMVLPTVNDALATSPDAIIVLELIHQIMRNPDKCTLTLGADKKVLLRGNPLDLYLKLKEEIEVSDYFWKDLSISYA